MLQKKLQLRKDPLVKCTRISKGGGGGGGVLIQTIK